MVIYTATRTERSNRMAPTPEAVCAGPLRDTGEKQHVKSHISTPPRLPKVHTAPTHTHQRRRSHQRFDMNRLVECKTKFYLDTNIRGLIKKINRNKPKALSGSRTGA